MIACAADEIIMGSHSFIGPTDPQLQLATAVGVRLVPAQAIIEQFETAVSECQDQNKMRAWLPMLAQYGPDLLVTCRNAARLSKDLISDWLGTYMFAAEPDAKAKAQAVADWLGDHKQFKTHSRFIGRDEARSRGLKVRDLEEDKAFQDAVLSVHHAVSHSHGQSSAVKIIENHQGRSYMDLFNAVPPSPPQMTFPFPFVFPSGVPQAPIPPGGNGS